MDTWEDWYKVREEQQERASEERKRAKEARQNRARQARKLARERQTRPRNSSFQRTSLSASSGSSCTTAASSALTPFGMPLCWQGPWPA